jgi:hypothetical protein
MDELHFLRHPRRGIHVLQAILALYALLCVAAAVTSLAAGAGA